MNRLREQLAASRPFFGPVLHEIRPRMSERVEITKMQEMAWGLAENGRLDEAATLYDQAAVRWERLGNYDDFAHTARHMARVCRSGKWLW